MAGHHPLVFGFFLFSLWSLLCNAVDLYRADSRPYTTIQASKGFLPKGQSTFGVATPDTSLWNHVNGASNGFSKDEDGYVSTTSDPALAERWVTQFLNGNGYIYRIHSAPNMIDCPGTLGKYNPYPEEAEFAALGGIKDNQIIGWTPVRNGVKGKEELNPFYSKAIYGNMGTGGIQPKLAAFPAGHPAWKEAPWAEFSSCSKRRARDLFRRQSCGGLKSNQEYAAEYLEYVQAVCPDCQ
ncbi:cholera a subunit [Colletotrichum karsti]|uniref:Cholera a subunit n=1 Tax=Colletotrichum karsti TaxID=1095194 RepID=A0A9P6I2I7_9PEZI|nr:cholera a subunit [Colletotrichum karsti]KAF9875059.1 cholera a subunit [Colletotrichum karsti]